MKSFGKALVGIGILTFFFNEGVREGQRAVFEGRIVTSEILSAVFIASAIILIAGFSLWWTYALGSRS